MADAEPCLVWVRELVFFLVWQNKCPKCLRTVKAAVIAAPGLAVRTPVDADRASCLGLDGLHVASLSL